MCCRTCQQRSWIDWKVWPDGSAIELEDRDIQISVHGLMTAILPAMLPSKAIAALFASRGGQATSRAKRISSRPNGRKGGRPRGIMMVEGRCKCSQGRSAGRRCTTKHRRQRAARIVGDHDARGGLAPIFTRFFDRLLEGAAAAGTGVCACGEHWEHMTPEQREQLRAAFASRSGPPHRCVPHPGGTEPP